MQKLIRLFVTHRNAANLLMIILLVVGAAGGSRLNKQFFPDVSFPMVMVLVPWSGASAEDVEKNILDALEPELRYLDNIKDLHGMAAEGIATIGVEFITGTDMATAAAEVESAIDQVTTLPEDSEKPIIQRIRPFEDILRIVISGPFPEESLKNYAKYIRDELIDAGVDKVNFLGVRDSEILVEVPEAALRQLNMNLPQISQRIAQQSLDIPSGIVEGSVERQVRSVGKAVTADAVGAIEIRSLESGDKIFLRDIAQVTDSFEDSYNTQYRHQNQAVVIVLERASTADVLDTSHIAETRIDEIRAKLPPTLDVEIYDVRAVFLQERIDLMVRNGLGGLVLVVIILYIFLSGRLAFWVAAGIPVAMLATMAAMLYFGQSINMISLFGMIMTLGIIVDDAIVVAEHAAHQREQGLTPIQASEIGAYRMLGPVIAASLTTIAAFAPVLLIRDEIGQVMSAITYVVIAVVIASLIECFLILPGHLRGALKPDPKAATGFRKWFDDKFESFRGGKFSRIVTKTFDYRYLTVATALATLIIAIGLVASGRVQFSFFPPTEAETIQSNIVFSPGNSKEDVVDFLHEMERSAYAAERNLKEKYGIEEDLIVMAVGQHGRTAVGFFDPTQGDNVGGYTLELTPPDQRDVHADEFIAAWREVLNVPAGLDRLVIKTREDGPPGEDMDLRIYGGSPAELKAAAIEVRELLARFPGVSEIDDDLPYGKPEWILSLSARGAALGFTTESVGRELRATLEGQIAKRFARGDEEIKIRVQTPSADNTAELFRDMTVTSPSGEKVPLNEVVNLREERGFARLRHRNGHLEVMVSANIDEKLTTPQEVKTGLEESGIDELIAARGLSYRFGGRIEDTARAMEDLALGFMVSLVGIYVILAWVFASYSRPLVVMAIIPFGLVGAIVGHMVMGVMLNMLSLIALLGLGGILVNDSIILVTTIDEKIEQGMGLRDAVVSGVEDRLRAVLLTSLTTVGGLTPLMFETSMQAAFVVPMAITIAFGLSTATFLVLMVVPAMLGIQEDIRRLFGLKPSARQILDHDHMPAE